MNQNNNATPQSFIISNNIDCMQDLHQQRHQSLTHSTSTTNENTMTTNNDHDNGTIDTTATTASSIESSSMIVINETRIQDSDGFIGTIVYVGPVASSKNPATVYAGIIWDDITRGKHDGSVLCVKTNQLVRHFTSPNPNQGSFLKLSKVNFGKALTAALLKTKYVEMNAPIIAPNNILPHIITTKSGKQKQIELYGELQIRQRQQIQNLNKVSLRRLGISKAADDDVDDLTEFQHITDIDLAGNLLWNWTETIKIIQQFTNLEHFSIAYNHIRDIPKDVVASGNNSIQFPLLKILNLNNCQIQSFETIQWIGKTMPNLESLCIANSNLHDIIEHQELIGFKKLRNLDCTNCQFNQWKNQIDKFANLPKLESLNLDDNPIPTITINAGYDGCFPQLMSLQLSGTKIAAWMDLEGINSFSALKSLRFKNTSLTKDLNMNDVRSLCLARYPSLEYLNGSSISKKERVEAEKRYVTLITQSLQRYELPEDQNTNTINDSNTNSTNDETADNTDVASSKTKTTILEEHPRYEELRNKHKNLIVFSKTENKSDTLASTILNVTIKSVASSSCTMEPIIRRLPGTLNVVRLKALCSRHFNLDYDLIELRYKNNLEDDDIHLTDLDDDQQTLNYYGVCDGAIMIMNEMDMSSKRLEKHKQYEEQEQRIKEQNETIEAMKESKQQSQQ